MKRHPQFNEPQASLFCAFLYRRMLWEGKQFLFLHFMDFGEKSIMSEKERVCFNL